MDTTHDPIQRFSAYHSGDPHKVGLWADGDGHWVTYVDHVEAVRQAEQRERESVFAFHPEWTVTGMCAPDCLACRRLTELINERSTGYDEGRADERKAAARDALAAVREVEPVRDVDYPLHLIERREVLAAIAAALGEDSDE